MGFPSQGTSAHNQNPKKARQSYPSPRFSPCNCWILRAWWPWLREICKNGYFKLSSAELAPLSVDETSSTLSAKNVSLECGCCDVVTKPSFPFLSFPMSTTAMEETVPWSYLRASQHTVTAHGHWTIRKVVFEINYRRKSVLKRFPIWSPQISTLLYSVPTSYAPRFPSHPMLQLFLLTEQMACPSWPFQVSWQVNNRWTRVSRHLNARNSVINLIIDASDKTTPFLECCSGTTAHCHSGEILQRWNGGEEQNKMLARTAWA